MSKQVQHNENSKKIIIKWKNKMERFIKLSFVLVCILFTVSCKTVIEEAKEEKPKETISFGGMDMEMIDIEDLPDSLRSLADSLMKEAPKMLRAMASEMVKRKISISPNPTSSFVTIKLDNDIPGRLDGWQPPTHNFRYDLIFDEKIIFKNEIKNIKQWVWQETIPEHLLQKNGMYIVAYELDMVNDGQVVYSVQNSINFMVIKKQ